MKKTFAFILIFVFLVSLSTPTYAAKRENYNFSEAIVRSAVSPKGVNIPTDATTLPYTANFYDLGEGSYIYTSYKFKPTGTDIQIAGTLYAAGDNTTDREAAIELYRSKGSRGELVATYVTGEFEDATPVVHTFSGLDSDEYYFILIDNLMPARPESSKDLEGSLYIY